MIEIKALKEALERIGYRLSESGTGHSYIYNHKKENTGIMLFGERIEYKNDKGNLFYFNRNDCELTVHEPDTPDGKMAVSIGTDNLFIQLYNY
jgi:hypothetical protein